MNGRGTSGIHLYRTISDAYLFSSALYRTKVHAYQIWFLLYRTEIGSYLFCFDAYLFSFHAYLTQIGSYLFVFVATLLRSAHTISLCHSEEKGRSAAFPKAQPAPSSPHRFAHRAKVPMLARLTPLSKTRRDRLWAHSTPRRGRTTLPIRGL